MPILVKGLPALALLFLMSYFLQARSAANSIDSFSNVGLADNSSDSQIENRKSHAGKNSDGVTPVSAPSNQTTVWLIAVDLVSSFGKNINQRNDKAPGFVRLASSDNQFLIVYSVNTLCQVDSELGHLFTLLGERPSGTS